MTSRPKVCIRAILFLCLASLALLPQAVTADPPSSAKSAPAPSPNTGDQSPAAAPSPIAMGKEPRHVPTKPIPPAALFSFIAVLASIAAMASIAALVFAILAWREAKGMQGRIEASSQNALSILSKLPTDISTTILSETRPLRTLRTDLENALQKLADQIKSGIYPSQAAQKAAPEPSEGSIPTNIMPALTGQLEQISRVNTSILDQLQSMKRQMAPPLEPGPPSLPTLLSQASDTGDVLIEAGQRLQLTFQKMLSGNQSGDHFLDNLAQTVFLPLSVPLAPPNLTEAQLTYRINVVGAIDRMRSQAAAQARKIGLEIMPVEVSRTSFDGNRHDAMLGTEIRTDRAELSGKVAEVLRHGFLQKNKDNSIKVLRKAQVRLFLQAQPKPVPPPAAVALPEPSPAPYAAPPEPAPVPSNAALVTQPVPQPAAKPESETVTEASSPTLSAPSEQTTMSAVPANPAAGAPTAQQEIDAWRGTSSTAPSIPDWERLAEALTVLHKAQDMDASSLDKMLAEVFTDDAPQSLVPQVGESSQSYYKAEAPLPGGVVAEVLRVGIEISRDGNFDRPVLPLVRLAPKQESK